jgi:2-polyprenyl-6-methoxyphenol hydroxylase-like FAD-dependent oxidoreductase
MNTEKTDVVVLGAGISGLTAADRLNRAGVRVEARECVVAMTPFDARFIAFTTVDSVQQQHGREVTHVSDLTFDALPDLSRPGAIRSNRRIVNSVHRSAEIDGPTFPTVTGTPKCFDFQYSNGFAKKGEGGN